jgi:hypothetical protein
MWEKGTPLHFIIDSGSQNNVFSEEVFKRLSMFTTPHLQPYTIGWLCQGNNLYVSQQFFLLYNIKPSKMRYCVMFLLSKFVIFFWDNLIFGNAMLYMSLGLAVLLLL